MIRFALVALGLTLAPNSEDEPVWKAISTTNAPSAREDGTAVWTGTEVLVWGGADASGYVATGAAYDPAKDVWRSLPTKGAPTPRAWHTAVWSGTEMIVWGGVGDGDEDDRRDGAAYEPTSNRWRSLSLQNAPSARGSHVAVWADGVMFVWAGVDDEHSFPKGATYDPVEDAWTPFEIQLKWTPRTFPAVWTGSEVLTFGGINGSHVIDDGIAWSRESGKARTLPKDAAPSARSRHSAVWTGTEFVVWGGANTALSSGALANGGRFDPESNTWRPMTLVDAPSACFDHGAVWTGTEMWIVGGRSEVRGDARCEVHAWHPNKGWRTMTPLPEGLSRASVIATDAGVLVLDGGDSVRTTTFGFVWKPKGD